MTGLLDGTIIDDEVAIEGQATRDGVARYRRLVSEAVDREQGAALKPAERMLKHWLAPMIAGIKREKIAYRNHKPGIGRTIYGPMLQIVDAERLAVLAISETLSSCMAEPDGIKVSKLSYSIGRAAISEANLDMLKADHGKELKKLDKRCQNRTPVMINWFAKRTLDDPIWSRKVSIQTGCILLKMLLDAATVNKNDNGDIKPAFNHITKWENGKSIKFIAVDGAVLDIIEEGHELRQFLRPVYLPMLVQPMAWEHETEGGYVKVRTPFISKPTPCQKTELKNADLAHVHECLNAINATPWQINKPILEVVKQLWESGGGCGRVPYANDFPMPPRTDDPEKVKERKEERRQTWDKNYKLKCERQQFLMKLDIAEQFSQYDRFWYPHQMDFRGRAYPIPAHLNHQGDDPCRGLLQFADERPVTVVGARWIAIHLANCCGIDKVSFDQREQWVEDNQEVLAGWVDDPLENTGWLEVDKPWQALAAAFALCDPDAAAHLPVQVDGTCNGLQHYAALGRDVEGAAIVNIIPGDMPSDVYGDVAEVTRRIVAEDCERGVPEAIILVDEIDRTLVKQTVMTSVYGVTMVGAREQILNKLRDLGYEDESLYKASFYLSRVVLSSIGEVCSSATEIMDWLKRCARIITSKPIKELVGWTTPIGLPVLQPYRKWSTETIYTVLQDVTAAVDDCSVPVQGGQHANGFPPNYIHSLDSAHMMMTGLSCYKEGVAFAAVHDGYWAHAEDVPALNTIIRQEFVELHSADLLAALHRELKDRYPDGDFPDPPALGGLDIKCVMDSEYFFN